MSQLPAFHRRLDQGLALDRAADACLMRELAFDDVVKRLRAGRLAPVEAVKTLRAAYHRAECYYRGIPLQENRA
jgi:hypothetical protein